jgi:acetyl esterase/lipase
VHARDVIVHENIAYKTGRDLSEYERERCALDLYLPAGSSGFPVIVWFHGGNITAGDKAGDAHVAIARTLADRGIGVASVNYRLSPRASFPDYVDDAAAGIAWVLDHIDEYQGNAGAVFVSGHSAGAYLASLVGLDERYLANYGHAPGDLAGLMPISGQMITHGTVRTERGLPADQPIVDGAAPVNHVNPDAPPFLAIAGAEDLPARAEESRYFVAAMKAVGHPDVTYLEVAGRTHGTIVTQIPNPDDPVAEALIDFVERIAAASR